MPVDSDSRLVAAEGPVSDEADDFPRPGGDISTRGETPSGQTLPPPLPAQVSTPTPPPPPLPPSLQPVQHTTTLPVTNATAPERPNKPPKHSVTGSVLPRRRRRFGKYVVLLALAGGIAAIGILYGSDLMNLAKGDSNGPTAPLAFPTPTESVPAIRTATFTVENPRGSDLPQHYEVTTDFSTGISRVIVDRPDQPQIEILTIFDGAVIRRTDEQVWYALERGEFPLNGNLGREQWVRSLDELFPQAIRKFATIQDASEESVGDELTRRLVVSIDPVHLTAQEPVDSALTGGESTDNAVTVELWVDGSGTIRHLVLPEVLGGESITVISTSPDAWQPQFPGQEFVKPLTPSALFSLGL